MTIPMPDPVAYAIFSENGNIRIWSRAPRDLPDLDSLGPMHQLITTTQAEAYAVERIMAVLKEVAEVADDNNDFKTFDAVLDMIDGFRMKK